MIDVIIGVPQFWVSHAKCHSFPIFAHIFVDKNFASNSAAWGVYCEQNNTDTCVMDICYV